MKPKAQARGRFSFALNRLSSRSGAFEMQISLYFLRFPRTIPYPGLSILEIDPSLIKILTSSGQFPTLTHMTLAGFFLKSCETLVILCEKFRCAMTFVSGLPNSLFKFDRFFFHELESLSKVAGKREWSLLHLPSP